MYTFIPDTYNYKKIESKFGSLDLFNQYQAKYKNKFEEYLYKVINFNDLSAYINSQNVEIPPILDGSYNFYHNNSGLKSNYIFMRNNIHIENLSDEDLEYLINNENIDSDFFSRSFKSVLLEEGDSCFFGTPKERNLVPSDNLVFEFAYNIKQCKDYEQTKKINEIINYSFDFLKKEFESKTNIKVSFIVYDAIQDIFDKNDEKSFI